MARPKWLLKPIDMYKAEWGFRRGGEGIIYDYEKRGKYQNPKISFIVLA